MALALTRRDPGRIEATREQFLSAWARTDRIFEIIPAEEIERQPIVWRHPFIFYVGHLPAFSWNQICGSLLKWKSFNPYFDELFCRGIDPDVDTGECHWHPEVPQAWPNLADTLEYRDPGARRGFRIVGNDRQTAFERPHGAKRAGFSNGLGA